MVPRWPFMHHKFSVFFLQNCKQQEIKKIVFYVIAFDQNKIMKLNFVKEINVVGQKMTSKGRKMQCVP